ncbi:MAG: TfoX/Sxy family protein [Rhodopseudomonas sp.]|uniref:TfoX/Sxy family protein n=1 Tax=Rhodopseudomonas sp. TaxID=1078 RepID=UPI0039E34652
MDREFLADLFAPFGPVTIRRMFSGFGISADGVTFALVIRDAIYLRTDDATIARFEGEGSQPFSYTTRERTVTVASYWRLPDRLLDEPDELAEWSRAALAAAGRAALAKLRKPKRRAATSSAKSTVLEKKKTKTAKTKAKATMAAPTGTARRSVSRAADSKRLGAPGASKRMPQK